jgi:hypothetical protein
MNLATKEKIVHQFQWGAGTYQVELHLPRDIKQIPSIEQAVKEGYVPYRVRAWPIGSSRWKPIGLDEVRNTVRGYSAILELEDLDIPDRAKAYVPGGIAWENKDVSRQMIIDFLFLIKK